MNTWTARVVARLDKIARWARRTRAPPITAVDTTYEMPELDDTPESTPVEDATDSDDWHILPPVQQYSLRTHSRARPHPPPEHEKRYTHQARRHATICQQMRDTYDVRDCDSESNSDWDYNSDTDSSDTHDLDMNELDVMRPIPRTPRNSIAPIQCTPGSPLTTDYDGLNTPCWLWT
jgi:hypothetical protein